MNILLHQSIAILGLGLTGQSFLRFLHDQLDASARNEHEGRELKAIHVHDLRLQLPVKGVETIADADCLALIESLACEHELAITYDSDATNLPSTIDALFVGPGVSPQHAWVRAARDQSIRVFSDLELFLAKARELDLTIVGVTGSNGKSTVVSALAHALRQIDEKVLLLGNIGAPVLDALPGLGKEHRIVLELSSFQLELLECAAISCACILNISPDHLDRYASLEAYSAAKQRIYAGSSLQVFNSNDAATVPAGLQENKAASSQTSAQGEHGARERAPAFAVVRGELNLWRVVGSNAGIEAIRLDSASDRSTTSRPIAGPAGSHHFRFDSLSEGSALWCQNLASCLALGLALFEVNVLSWPALERLAAALDSFVPLDHRYQKVGARNLDGLLLEFIDDSKATNEGAARSALKAAAQQYHFVVVIAGGLAKGADLTAFARELNEKAQLVCLIGEDRELIRREIAKEKTFLADGLVSCLSYLKEWLEEQRETLESPGVCLLSPACASMDMFQNYRDRGLKFQAAVDEVFAEVAA